MTTDQIIGFTILILAIVVFVLCAWDMRRSARSIKESWEGIHEAQKETARLDENMTQSIKTIVESLHRIRKAREQTTITASGRADTPASGGAHPRQGGAK